MTKFKLSAILLVLFFMSGLISCTKKSENTSDKNINEAEMVAISNEDFTETDEDLLTVDYKEFYDELAPHGEWIEVKGSDIGVDLKNGTASNDHKTISINDFLGVKDAYADDVSFGAFFVWQPAPNLAVGITAGETQAQPVYYVPYSNGQWSYTSNGWYFRAASEPEEITHHYGRWVFSPSLGWVWVPGRVWAPAWVDWREENDFIAWVPLPPSIYISNNIIIAPPVYEERYIVVEKRHFCESNVYNYVYWGHKNRIKEWRRLDGIMVVNKTIVNTGPDVTVIRNITGAPLDVVSISKVKKIKEVNYSSNEYKVFSPDFKKVNKKVKVDKIIRTPENFITYDNAKVKNEVKNKDGNADQNNNESSIENKNRNSGNDGNKDFRNNRKYIDDGKMKDGGKTKNNGKVYDKNNGERKKDNKNKDNGNNDKVKKDNKGNDNSKGKDNGKYKKNGKEKNNKKFKNDKNNPSGNDRSGKDKNNGKNKNDNGKVKGKDTKGNDKGSNDKSKNNSGKNNKRKK